MPMAERWNIPFFVTILFWIFIAIFGGSSRADAPQLLILRPLMFLFLAYGLIKINVQQIKSIAFPLAIILLLGLWMLIQLIPLSPENWQSLPDRQTIIDAQNTLGMTGVERSIALSPSRGWNSFFALFIGLTALILYAINDTKSRRFLLLVIFIVIVLSMVFGIGQTVSGAASMLYYYDIQNKGLMTGFFANRNHQGTLVALAPIILSWFWLTERAKNSSSSRENQNMSHKRRVAFLLIFIFSLLCLSYNLVLGSRSGAITVMLSLMFVMLIINFKISSANSGRLTDNERKMRKFSLFSVALFAASLIALLFTLNNRNLAFSRYLSESLGESSRAQITPTLMEMAQNNYVFGSGFGSFEFLFKIYEPTAFLSSSYLNNAHNDILQLIMEGGLPAIILALASILWVLWTVFHAWRLSAVNSRHWLSCFCGLACLVIIIMASIGDYPVRTPIFTALLPTLAAAMMNFANDMTRQRK